MTNSETIRLQILAHSLPGMPYMMPDAMLPLMNCEKCTHFTPGDRMDKGEHCYMFFRKPDGDRCGQFTKVQN